jgi:hypothetical protein
MQGETSELLSLKHLKKIPSSQEHVCVFVTNKKDVSTFEKEISWQQMEQLLHKVS